MFYPKSYQKNYLSIDSISLVDIQTVLTYLSLISVPVGVFYYIMTLQNSNKNQQLTLKAQELTVKAQQQSVETRQAQLFMQLYDRFNEPEFRKIFAEIIWFWEWKDMDDFENKYGYKTNMDAYSKRTSMYAYFEGMGLLLRRGLIDIQFVYDLSGGNIMRIWEKMEPVIMHYRSINRSRRNEWHSANSWDDFEYLYNEIKRKDSEMWSNSS